MLKVNCLNIFFFFRFLVSYEYVHVFFFFFKLTCLNNIRCVSRFKKKKKNNLLYYVYTIFPLRKELENYTWKCNNRYRVEFSVERFLNIPELFLFSPRIFSILSFLSFSIHDLFIPKGESLLYPFVVRFLRWRGDRGISAFRHLWNVAGWLGCRSRRRRRRSRLFLEQFRSTTHVSGRDEFATNSSD